ncbi:unnamed protein product, partial [Discosporangium mesarthrocarpum]
MPRMRRTVSRFDPSPEMVASWNDTSAVARKEVESQARFRHGLGSASKKRSRGQISGARAHQSKSERQKTSGDQSRRRGAVDMNLDDGGRIPTVRRRGPKLNSGSLSATTSGSDSDTCSWASETSGPNESRLWQGVGEVGGECDGRRSRGGGVGSGADTDSEASSDISSGEGSTSASSVKPSSSSSSSPAPRKKEEGPRKRGEERLGVAEAAGTGRGRNVVRVRVARSQMPVQWAESPPKFTTCLSDLSYEEDAAPGAAAAVSLMGLCAGDRVEAKTWLTSGFIDVVMAKFARTYAAAHFMPIEFAALSLRSMGLDGSGNGGGSGGSCPSAEALELRDIRGRKIDYSERRPVIFLANIQNLHWNLLRVEHHPVPELQLFEPMGKPARRQSSKAAVAGGSGSGGGGGGGRGGGGGAVFRYIPKEVFRWLDAVWPLEGGVEGSPVGCSSGGAGSGGGGRVPVSWKSRAYSAITRQQQTTGFDCGVASLLYAEKCGQGQMREDVDEWTTQGDMTEYRMALQRYVEFLL